MLFDYISNFPDVNSNDEEDGGEPEITWVEDEVSNSLSL